MSNIIETEVFVEIGSDRIDTSITYPDGPAKADAVFLHGAGFSTKERCLPLARALSSLGWRCLTFSYPGHGSSSGRLLGSSLQNRKLITKQLLETLGFESPEVVVGVSMGAHTAIAMLEELAIMPEKLILFAPAIYASEAEATRFGPEFSKILRTEQSYLSSKSWDILPTFGGKLAMVEASNDEVIPKEMYSLIRQSAIQASEIHHLIIDGSAHQISFWLAEDPARISSFALAIDAFDFEGLETFGVYRAPTAVLN